MSISLRDECKTASTASQYWIQLRHLFIPLSATVAVLALVLAGCPSGGGGGADAGALGGNSGTELLDASTARETPGESRASPQSDVAASKKVFKFCGNIQSSAGIVAAPDGALWLADTNGNQIGRVSTGGTFTLYPLPSRTSLGPSAITVGPDKNLWFTENANRTIGFITPDGVITELSIPAFTTSLLIPTDIASGPDGNLWVTAIGGGSYAIVRVAPTGDSTVFPLQSRPSRIAAGPDGRLWFTEDWNQQIGRITTDGVLDEFPVPTANSFPTNITAGPDGNMWFIETVANQIGRITVSGAISEFPIPTASRSYGGIAAGKDGNVWFAEEGKRIARVTPDGVITEFAVSGGSPLNIVAGPDGNLWFDEGYLQCVGYVSL
jgi:virginiamycin B lyase